MKKLLLFAISLLLAFTSFAQIAGFEVFKIYAGDVSYNIYNLSNNASARAGFMAVRDTVDTVYIYVGTTETVFLSNQTLDISTTAGDISIDPAGNNVIPGSDNTDILGIANTRWANIFSTIVSVGDTTTGDVDAFIYFADDASTTAHSLKWDDGNDRFEASADFYAPTFIIGGGTGVFDSLIVDAGVLLVSPAKDSVAVAGEFVVSGGSILAYGTVGTTPASGAGTRLMWIPSKYAFRAGKVDGVQWDAGSIGEYSVAFGQNNTASGDSSVVSGGANNTASGGASTVIGGISNVASGRYSIAMGQGATASGIRATAIGNGTTASGDLSFAVGGGVTASGDWATAIGNSVTASGDFSMATGYRAKSNHDGTFIWSDNTEADFASTATKQFLIRAGGGVGIGTESPGTLMEVAGNNGDAAFPFITQLNNDEGLTGEIAQTVDMIFEVKGTINSGSSWTNEEASKISTYKIGDYFTAGGQADNDAGIKIYTVTDGAYVLNSTFSDDDLTVVGTVGSAALAVEGITITPTSTGNLIDLELEDEWTNGLVMIGNFGSNTTLSGDISGIYLDFESNVINTVNRDINGFIFKIPSQNNTSDGPVISNGFRVSGGAFITSSGSGDATWKGLDVALPDITEAGTNEVYSYGVYVDGGTVTSGTEYGIYVNSAKSLFNIEDAATNSVANSTIFSHTSTATPVAGFGGGIEFELEDNDETNNRIAATIEAIWTDAGEGVNADADLVFKTMLNDGAAAEAGRFTSAKDLSLAGNVLMVTGSAINWNSTDIFTHTANTMTLSGFTTWDFGAVATVDFNAAAISFTGGTSYLLDNAELDLTGVAATIDLNPAATGTQDVINITPSASLVAGSTWDGMEIDMNSLDPATGAASTLHGFHVKLSTFASTDGNSDISAFTSDHPVADASTGYSDNLRELTVNKVQNTIKSFGGTLVLSATGTYRGLYVDWDNITRDGGAPVLQGINVILPADYTGFGTSYAGFFDGGGESLTICDGTNSFLAVGAADIDGAFTAGTIASDNDIAVLATKKFLMDGIGGHTYWAETADDEASLFVGSVEAVTVKEATNVIFAIDKATPDGVHPDYTALQLGGNAHLTTTRAVGANGVLHLTHNANLDTDGSWEYISTDEATRYRQTSGTHEFYVVASGTAGDDITWITAQTIEIDGDIIAGFDLDVVADLTANTIVSDGIVTATTIVQGEHLTSTDDADINDQLDVGNIVIEETVGIIHDSLVIKRECSVVIDDGSIVLPDATTQSLLIWVDGDDEWAQCAIQSDGTVTILISVGSIVNTDTDTNLCIYDSGTGATIRNRLGSSKTVCYETKYKQ